MKYIIIVILLISSNVLLGQEDIYPIYKGCDAASETTLASCFNQNLTKDVLAEFKVSNNVTSDNYKGTVNVIFIVTKTGDFEVLYVRSAYKELEAEAKRVFALLPKAQPATYNGRAIDMRFGLPIQIPLGSQPTPGKITKEITKENVVVNTPTIPVTPQTTPTPLNPNTQKKDIQTAVVSTYFPEHQSELNIPFSHSTYDELSYYYDQNDNSHTGFKPFLYSETSKYVDLDLQKTILFKDKSSKWGKKLWNEHFFKVQKEDYWFTIDPLFDLQIGKDNSNDVDYTYNNTRAIQIQGGLGKNFNFSASIYESQGRFADYVNDFARANKGTESYGLVPGRGKAKIFKTNSFDYPVAEAYLTYTPSKFFNFQFGHGKNFVGDGYRSLMLSDAASSYPHLKISTQFWKIKYTNTWMWLDDVRPSVNVDNLSARKFVAMHHLSYNVTKRLNVSLFEAAITKKGENNGFDINYFNPIIFYRAVEFSRGSRGGNAIIGLGTKYKVSDNFSTYTQFVLDELTIGKIFDGSGYWANKFGIQVGAKYYNAFNVDNLYLQGEFNVVRPYTFSHKDPILNYAHYNQPLGHPWGSNFWEFVAIARYKKDRWFGSAKINMGNKGFDINGLNYGGNIYQSYEDRTGDTGIELLQGNNTRIFIADFQGGYLVNPATNTKLFAGIIFRKFNPAQAITDTAIDNSTWFTFGLKADLFNWYFDF
ncbi:gliding motility protein RemB [Aureibaculum algae]|uniref:Gliding motility protein RemB n=1 Tax=Aureibaculum algae TaxID=2584122 RepID=A0A5B7TSA8_9FLAO|nr:gliding motility protein RemB [Aureibaculum algae]QCX37522.1 gliding motility protein RemB [Aureibaculum algae]